MRSKYRFLTIQPLRHKDKKDNKQDAGCTIYDTGYKMHDIPDGFMLLEHAGVNIWVISYF